MYELELNLVQKERREVWSNAVVAATRREATFRASGTFESHDPGIKTAQHAVDWADHVLRCFDTRFMDQ